MKKIIVLFAAAVMAVSASAQTVTESKTFDNFFVGVQGGVSTKTTQNRWLSNMNANFGARVGRNFTPVFGLIAEGNAYLGNRFGNGGNWGKTAIKSVNVNLLGNVNFLNWFDGYKGEPRLFEVNGLFGFGWLHACGNKYNTPNGQGTYLPYGIDNAITSKAAIDFAFNLGANKAWQIFIEPSINWALPSGFRYNIDNSWVQLNAGVVYKFKNSNGTHNFTIAQLRDQAEIDELNRIINELRNRKPETVVKEVVKEVQVGKEVRVDDLVFVTFAQGKSALTADAKKALDNIKEGAHVQIVGTASPEGSKALNDKLSQARADVVADYLKGRGVIVDEAIGKGVQGTTSNRLAIVYVK